MSKSLKPKAAKKSLVSITVLTFKEKEKEKSGIPLKLARIIMKAYKEYTLSKPGMQEHDFIL